MTERLSPARASRSGRPSSNLSVGLAPASSPSRGASGEEAKLCGMPRPPPLGELASESETERAFLQKPLANSPEMRYNTSRGKSAENRISASLAQSVRAPDC